MQSATEHRALFERTGVDQYVATDEAATLLGVSPQTMRRWSCEANRGRSNPPIRPHKVNGRLRWSVTEIRAVLSGATPASAV